MPGFSSYTTRNPHITAVDGAVAFLIVKGDGTPYHLRSNGVDRYRREPNLPEYAEYEYYIFDEIDKRILSSFVLNTPMLTDSLMAQYLDQAIFQSPRALFNRDTEAATSTVSLQKSTAKVWIPGCSG